MAINYRRIPLDQVTKLTLSSVDKKVKPHEHEVLLCNYMDVYSNRFIRSNLQFMAATATEHEIQRCTLRSGDVVITKDSEQYDDIGVPTLVRDNVNNLVCGYHLAILRPLQELIDGAYLFYALQTTDAQHQFHAYANGITRFGLRKDDIQRIEIPLPRFSEQHAIAHILRTLDDKIELNRRMNETLEEMAQVLFKSWFIDFDPVRTKMEGRNSNLPKDLTDLFPDRLANSELGEIPEGWEVKTLGKVVEIVKGRSYRSKELKESDTALVTLKSFARRGGYRPEGLKSFSGTYKPEQVVLPGEIVIACTDVTQAADIIGRPAIVQATGTYRTLVASLDTLIVRPKEEITQAFLYLLLSNKSFVAHTYAYTTGTTVLHLAKDAVPSFRFVCPPKQLVLSFDDAIAPLLEHTQKAQQEEELHTTLRDTLLPKLISGEMRVDMSEHLYLKQILNI